MKWEYRQLDVPTRGILSPRLPDGYLDELNSLANEGWELVQGIPVTVGAGMTERVIFILKREREGSV
jgi:hypothetical protein